MSNTPFHSQSPARIEPSPIAEDAASAAVTGRFPELGDIGDEDIIADGGTQIMDRSPAEPEEVVVDGGAQMMELELGDEDIIDGGTQIMSRDLVGMKAPAKPASLQPPVPEAEAKATVRPSAVPASIPAAPETARLLEDKPAVEATQPFVRSSIFGAPAASQSPPLATYHPPSVVISEPPPRARSASIAPLAFDVAPLPAPGATLKLASVRPSAAKHNVPLLAGVIGGGLALCAAAIIALVSVGASGGDSAESRAPTVAAKPREAQKGSARSAVIETPETTPQKVAPPPGQPDEDGTPVFSASALPSAPDAREPAPSGLVGGSTSTAAPPRARSASRSSTSTAPAPALAPTPAPTTAPEPAPAAAPVASPRAPAPTSTTGTVQVSASLMTVMVDSQYQRVRGGRIVVSCGKHRINAGRGTQVVDVPCGGVVSVD